VLLIVDSDMQLNSTQKYAVLLSHCNNGYANAPKVTLYVQLLSC